MKTIVLLALFLPGMPLCAAPYAGWAVGEADSGYGTIFATTDSGTTWVRQGSGQIANVKLGGVYAIDPLTVWVAGDADSGYATIYQTTDGGATWTRKGLGQSALLGIDAAKLHVSSNVVWVIGVNAILRSRDDGATWTNCLPAAYTNRLLQGVSSCAGAAVWVGGAGSNQTSATLLQSTNAGLTWVQQSIAAEHILGIAAANAQTLWAVGGGGFVVFRTDDGGVTWIKQPTTGGEGDANEVCAVSTNIVWVAVDNFDEWSTNGGQTWASATMPYYTMGICAVNEREAWSVATGGFTGTGSIWHTSNGGGAWEQQGPGSGRVAPMSTVSFAREPVPEPAFMQHVLLIAIGMAIRLKSVRSGCYGLATGPRVCVN